MPKTQIDFQKTVIYKIVCNDLTVEYTYVGHSTDFTKRKNTHKTRCNNIKDKKYNLKVYQIMRANGGWTNWTVLQIESYPCNSSIEARLKEREWYEKLSSTMNSLRPFRSEEERIQQVKEYQALNKGQIAEQRKGYLILNAEKIALYQKNYKLLNKNKLSDQAKLYYENNKEKALEYQAKYQADNKVHISEQKKAYYLKNKTIKNNLKQLKDNTICNI